MAPRAPSWIVGAMVVAGVAAPRARAVQDTTRLSVDSAGVEADADSFFLVASADGQVVVFSSYATNLVAGDSNQLLDVFVRDRRSGATERVSVDSAGSEADNLSKNQGRMPISADGMLVVFDSDASNLDPNDTNGAGDVFLRDRIAGTTVLVSVDSAGVVGNGFSYDGSITPDGRFACFSSVATNLVAGDTNGTADIFVRDLTTGAVERVSVDTSGNEADAASYGPMITPDGRFVVFSSDATNLVAGDTNRWWDVFLRDRQTGTTERVSVSNQGKQGNGLSAYASISADGNRVAFESLATNFVQGDLNLNSDVFVRDRALGTTTRVSVDSAGAEGYGYSGSASIDAAGQRVAFNSWAPTLVPGDTNGAYDVFVHDLVTGGTERVSVDSTGAEGNDHSLADSIAPDGRAVYFHSRARNLVANDANGVYDVFVHEHCGAPATWTNYGAGFPGTHGVPAFTAQQFPALGATITVDLANSLGAPTVGLLVVGFQRASLPTKFGGDLLVLPFLFVPISFSYGSDSFTGTIPDDVDLCGATLDLQGIEVDPGAQFGVSFSQGLELVVGR